MEVMSSDKSSLASGDCGVADSDGGYRLIAGHKVVAIVLNGG